MLPIGSKRTFSTSSSAPGVQNLLENASWASIRALETTRPDSAGRDACKYHLSHNLPAIPVEWLENYA
jgi:hypothetical protein